MHHVLFAFLQFPLEIHSGHHAGRGFRPQILTCPSSRVTRLQRYLGTGCSWGRGLTCKPAAPEDAHHVLHQTALLLLQGAPVIMPRLLGAKQLTALHEQHRLQYSASWGQLRLSKVDCMPLLSYACVLGKGS